MAWCERKERERKDRVEQRTKRQFFCRPQEKVQSRLKTFGSRMKLRIWPAFDSFDVVFSGRCINNQRVCIILFVCGKIATVASNALSSF